MTFFFIYDILCVQLIPHVQERWFDSFQQGRIHQINEDAAYKGSRAEIDKYGYELYNGNGIEADKEDFSW